MSTKPKTEGADRRTKAARRLKALVKSLTDSLCADGQPLAEDEAGFVRLAAAAMIRGDIIADAVGRGNDVDDAELVRLLNVSQRTMKELREERARRSTAKPASGLTPMQEYLASVAARKAERAAEPVEDDDDAEVELHPAIVAFAARQAEQRGKPSEAEAVQTPSTSPGTVANEPVKPAGQIEVYLNSRPRTAADPQGQTLVEVVADLQATAPNAKIKFTGPAFSRDGMSVDQLSVELGPQAWLMKGSERLAARRDWFIR